MRKHGIRRLFGFLMAFCMALSCCAGAGGADMEPPGVATADAMEADDGIDKPDALENVALFNAADDGMMTDAPKGSAAEVKEAELFADTNRCGENALWTLEDGVLKITGTGEMSDFNRGGAPWYDEKEEILSVEIENGITKVGFFAFEGCSNLQNVLMPQSLKEISHYAFDGCVHLTALNIPANVETIGAGITIRSSVTDFHVSTGNPYFREKDGILFIGDKMLFQFPCGRYGGLYEIPEGISIASMAFLGSELKYISIPSGVTEIPYGTFGYCKYLYRIQIPDSVTKIDEMAFYQCYALSDVYYSGSETRWSEIQVDSNNESLTEAAKHWQSAELPIENAATFGTCGDNLTWSLNERGLLTIKGSGPMMDYSPEHPAPWPKVDIREFSIGDGVTRIGNYAFAQCPRLNRLIDSLLYSNITEIGSHAFYRCKTLQLILLPETLISIEDYAFSESPLQLITFFGNKEQWESMRVGENASPVKIDYIDGKDSEMCGDNLIWELSPSKGTLTIRGSGDMYDYSAHDMPPWISYVNSISSVVIEEGVVTVGNYAFTALLNLTDVIFPQNSLKKINERAFAGTAIQQIKIPDSVTHIGERAFEACENLSSFTFGSGITSIGKLVFAECGLASVRIPSFIASIGESTFSKCQSLVSVIIEDGTESIALGMFSECSNLSNLYLPASLKFVQTDAFYDCHALTDVYFGRMNDGQSGIEITLYPGNDALKSSQVNNHTDTPNPSKLTDISLTGLNGATITRGMSLDISALAVTAEYADGTSAPVSSYSLFGFNSDRLGRQTIGVRYLNQETTFEVTVVEAGVTGLSISSMPTRRDYRKGDALDLSGLVLTATYSDYSTKTVTDSYSVSGYDANITGEQRVTISYAGAQTGLTVNVSELETNVAPPRVSVTDAPGGKTVALVSGTVGGVIWYWTNDSLSSPTATSQRYDAPFTLTHSDTVTAYTELDGVKSDIISVPVTVGQVSPVTEEVSGNVVTLRTETPGATIYYGFDVANVTREYVCGIMIDRNMTVYAVAKKDGWRDSEPFQANYAPDDSGETENAVEVTLLDAEGTSGELLSVPVFMYPNGEEDTITSFQITILYDSEKFELQSVQPSEGVKNILQNAGAEKGCVVLYYNRIQKEENPSVEPGEIFTLFLKAKLSSTDGEYAITVDEEQTDICSSASVDSAPLKVSNSKITLSDTVNSLVRRVTLLSSSLSDNRGNAVSSLATPGTARTSFTLEEVSALRGEGDLVLNIVRAVYAQDGTMLLWDMKPHNFTLNSAFSELIEIPPGAAGGSVKAMIMDDDLSPRAPAIPLLGGVR